MSEAEASAQIALARSHAVGDLLRRSAARMPGKTAIIYQDLRQSYAELDETVNRMANALAERDVARGDRIALFSHNNHAFVVAYFALARLGAVSVPVNFMLTADEVGYVLEHWGERPDRRGLAGAGGGAGHRPGRRPAHGPGRDRRRAAGMGAGDRLDGPSGRVAARRERRRRRADAADLHQRDGVTAQGRHLSARSLITQYVTCIVDGQMSADDIEVHSLPLYHCAQLHCFLTPGIYLGATNIVLPGADPAAILATIEAEQATKLFCPPTVWISLLRHPDFGRRDLSSLRKGYYGASIMPVEVLKEIAARLPDVRLFNFYGQTEMAPLATVLAPEDQMRKAGSAGRPALNVETRVVDEGPAGRGRRGRGDRAPQPARDAGLLERPGQDRRGVRQRWFHSGDLGVLDDDGYLTVVDRKKDMIKSGGENVASREVEEVLYQHPGVAEAAVFGLPHPRWIEAVSAAVVPREGAAVTAEQLIAHCRGELAGFRCPSTSCSSISCPRTPAGSCSRGSCAARFSRPGPGREQRPGQRGAGGRA